MSNPQLGADVTPELKAKTAAYAQRLGISESALLHLLVRRELRKRRLSELCKVAASAKCNPRIRLTAHRPSVELKDEFHSHIQSLGIDSATAIATLVGAEMEEEWLARS